MHKIIEDLNWRYAAKKFDSTKSVSEKDLDIIKESLRLVPSSYGLQPLKFIIIQSKNILRQLVPASYGQAQVGEASHLIVLCAAKKMGDSQIDEHIQNTADTQNSSIDKLLGYGNYMKTIIAAMSNEEVFTWNTKQAYIALGQLMHTCANLRIDSTPMEGFDPKAYSEILSIDDNQFSPVLVCPIGYRDKDDTTQFLRKVRKPNATIFEHK
ncbi:MAG: NAD(P)H-dependent oxidoreductase [Flavobacteriales bacterium]